MNATVDLTSAQNARFNANSKRPWIGSDGNTYITVFKGGDAAKPENYESLKVNTTGTLRRDEWKMLDDTVIGIAEKRLVGINDLVSRGLVFNLGNGMATTVLEHHDVGDALTAELSMDAKSRAKGDRVEFGTNYLPIPIIHADYEINERVLMASRNMGNPLDTTMAERAARKVSEKLESMLFTDTSYTYGGGTIYSYLNYPSRITGSLGAAWGSSGYTGADILNDVLAMKQEAIDNHRYGPYVLYIPTAYETIMDEDFSSSKGTDTIRERLLKVGNITDIKVIDTLTADNVLLVQMTSDVVRLVRGMAIQNVQWQTEGGFVNKFKVMTIQVPQIRTSQDQLTGVVHYS
jgi:hypothetical protein